MTSWFSAAVFGTFLPSLFRPVPSADPLSHGSNLDRGHPSLQCRRILARSRASAFDQASAILDSNSEEAWGETKMRPRE